MLKIRINNEEVVSNKDFTINEEMLNTSSVILNNVYPKTWENDKDYVSRFYHPNDYSKCMISDETDVPEEPGTTVEDTSFSINVDTTKEYEFTSYKGQTTQSGTPTPDSPQDIHIVSGDNTIDICGKNLFKLDRGNGSLNDFNLVVNEDKTVTITGGRSTVTYFNLHSGQLPIKPNTTYTISGAVSPSAVLRIRIFDENGTSVYAQFLSNKLTFTTPSNGVKYDLYIVLYASQTSVTYKPQLELGDIATTYEEYKGASYPISLGVENLFDKDNANYVNGWIDGTTMRLNTINGNRMFYIPCKPNTTYTISRSVITSSFRTTTYDSTPFPTVTSSNVNYTVPTVIQNNSGTTLTITTNANAKYLIVHYGKTEDTNLNEMLATIQVEYGSKQNSYTPYGTTPIELCKIGDYQDSIVKDNGKWYLNKQIGKVVLNGSTNRFTQIFSTNTSGINRYRTNEIPVKLQASRQIANVYCDKLIPRTIVNTYSRIQGISVSDAITMFIIYIDDIGTYTLEQANNWLSTNNLEIYYVLATPTYTEITDSELIYQLEGIRLIEGLNNIGISTPYLPMIMNLHYNFVIPRTDVDILFCGVVKNSGNISLNPRDPHYQTLQILSYKTFLSEGETLDFVIYQKTIKEAIEQVVGVIADYGFVVGNINLTNGDEVIGAYSTKDKTAYDVFNYLADITQSRWTTRLIDENTVAIDFYDPTLLPLGTAIDYTNECFENHTIDNMSYSYGSNDYRNKQVMTSQEVYSNISQTQSVIANGYQTQFNVEQKIGKINSIKIGSTSYTIATNQEKEMGVSADFYYTPGNNYFESATTIAVGTSITVEYIPIVEGRQIISNSTEIDRIANSTGVKGVIARYENRNDAITSQELQKIGQSYIKYKGVPEIILTVQTRSNLWNIGDRVPFNAPIDELKTEYMVKAKKINYITTIDTIFYTYELTSSFNSENAINYFDNQRAKATGNIGSGEYISRNIDIQSDANIIFYDTTATEIEIVGDNTLEAVLEAPFVS